MSGNAAGIGWMVAAMAAFAVEDVLIKHVTRALPIGQVLMLFGAGGACLFAALAWRSGSGLLPAQAASRVMWVRAGFELVGRLFYALAIVLTPLSSATALLQATPIVVVLGAMLFLGERVGWQRWCAIGAGLLGVLIILRPAVDDFSVLSLLAVVATLGFAGRDLASRVAPAALSTWLLGLYGFLMVVLAGALVAWWQGQPLLWPSGPQALTLLATVLVGCLAYAALMRAMRTGSVAVVTPFRYTRLLFGLSLGVWVFGERVDGPMLLGCAVIIGAGLFIPRRTGPHPPRAT